MAAHSEAGGGHRFSRLFHGQNLKTERTSTQARGNPSAASHRGGDALFPRADYDLQISLLFVHPGSYQGHARILPGSKKYKGKM